MVSLSDAQVSNTWPQAQGDLWRCALQRSPTAFLGKIPFPLLVAKGESQEKQFLIAGWSMFKVSLSTKLLIKTAASSTFLSLKNIVSTLF